MGSQSVSPRVDAVPRPASQAKESSLCMMTEEEYNDSPHLTPYNGL